MVLQFSFCSWTHEHTYPKHHEFCYINLTRDSAKYIKQQLYKNIFDSPPDNWNCPTNAGLAVWVYDSIGNDLKKYAKKQFSVKPFNFALHLFLENISGWTKSVKYARTGFFSDPFFYRPYHIETSPMICYAMHISIW